MKGKGILIVSLMLVLSLIGGNALLAKDLVATNPTNPDQKNLVGKQPDPGNQGITVNSIPFTEIKNMNQMPEPVQELVKNHRKERGYEVWQSEEGAYYLAVFAGEKPTGGHGIEVTQIEDNEGITNVTVQEKTPAKDAMVTMAITYPYTVVKFTGTTDQFQVYLTTGQKLTQDGQLLDLVSVSYTEVKDLRIMPEPVQEMVKNQRKQAGYDIWKSEDGIYYLALFAGKKSTGGYGVEVESVEVDQGVTNVKVRFTSPKKGAMVTQAISYPYTVLRITGATEPFQVFLNTGQKMTPNGEAVDIIKYETPNEEISSANEERLKTLHFIADAWVSRLTEIEQILKTARLTPERREIMINERDFVWEEWKKAQAKLKEVMTKVETHN